MQREEALHFLEISNDATAEQVKRAYAEKYNFFQMLLANAPNTIIKGLQQKNIDKLAAISKMFELDTSDTSPISAAQLAEREEQVINRNIKKPDKGLQLAWLILHTEGQSIRMFPLYAGETLIGRVLEGPIQLITINNDPYVSRVHCIIRIQSSHSGYQAFVFDDGKYGSGKPSKNGIYLNGNDQRITGEQEIGENDTLQIGYTKLVFKWNDVRPVTEIEEEVAQTEFVKTIVIGL